MNNEHWKAVLGWEAYYEVSSLGRLRSKPRKGANGRTYGGHEVAPIAGSRGYLVVNLSRPGLRRQLFLHKVVLEAFMGARPDGAEACHNNGERHDCRLENLRWDSRSANHQDKRLHGTAQIGERANNVRATEAAVREIRERGLSLAEAQRQFGRSGLSATNFKRIKSGRTWRHVGE
jgi:hypothetical protein